jgi:sialate O-acetylesterase
VFDDFGDGGFGSLASVMQIAPADAPSEGVSIAGDWRFLVEHDIGIVPASVFAGSPGSPADSTPQNQYCRLYNGMINPLVPYGIRGALWYQGEANEGNSGEYGERIRGMIRDWRSSWAQGDFPFYYVQLACYSSVMDWAPLRAAQDEALLEPNTGRALAIDIGNANDIHPTNKQEVARRLALVALADAYGLQGFESRGPEFAGFSVEGARVRVRFSHSSGLHTVGNAGEVLGFEVAGADGVFHRVCGRIDGGEVVLSCGDVASPVAVRYAWESAPSVNLVNGDNLPAAPFNTAR